MENIKNHQQYKVSSVRDDEKHQQYNIFSVKFDENYKKLCNKRSHG
jgi:hypothetical protein